MRHTNKCTDTVAIQWNGRTKVKLVLQRTPKVLRDVKRAYIHIFFNLIDHGFNEDKE